jgi:hypothetical protein
MEWFKAFRRVSSSVGCTLLLMSGWALAGGRQQDTSANTTGTTSSKTTPHANAAKPSSTRKRPRKKSAHVRGQQKIDSERAREIQDALIREHYLTGEPTGTWNQTSEDAMRRYQEDHGWQTKEVPDSRALIKLGLGPSKDHLLNPESAMTTAPDAPRSDGAAPVSHTTPPVSNPPTQAPAPSDPPNPQ